MNTTDPGQAYTREMTEADKAQASYYELAMFAAMKTYAVLDIGLSTRYKQFLTEAIELLELGKSQANKGGYVIVISPRRQIFFRTPDDAVEELYAYLHALPREKNDLLESLATSRSNRAKLIKEAAMQVLRECGAWLNAIWTDKSRKEAIYITHHNIPREDVTRGEMAVEYYAALLYGEAVTRPDQNLGSTHCLIVSLVLELENENWMWTGKTVETHKEIRSCLKEEREEEHQEWLKERQARQDGAQ